MKIAGVVVTYNRKEELIKNIESILDQTLVIDKYYIIDNHGTDNTKDFLKEHGLLNNKIIEYVYLDENIGGAGGFYTGLKMAYEAGYDYICLMDDDGRPANREMMKYLVEAGKKIQKKNKMFLINSLVFGQDEKTLSFGLTGGIRTVDEALQVANQEGMIEKTINPFNGTLVSKELVEKIGFPNKDFFIKGDEFDYQRRSIKAGAAVHTICKSLYYHPKLERIKARIFFKKFWGSTESPWKEYYRARNYTYMYSKDKERMKYIRQNIKQILMALKYNPKKSETVKMILKGWKDGKKGNLGATVKP